MKVLYCQECGCIRSFKSEWTACECGNMQVKWINPLTGTVLVRAKNKRTARIIGMHNGFLQASADYCMPPKFNEHSEYWRNTHAQLTTEAKGYLFHDTHRKCWAAIIRVGDSSDVSYEAFNIPEAELEEKYVKVAVKDSHYAIYKHKDSENCYSVSVWENIAYLDWVGEAKDCFTFA